MHCKSVPSRALAQSQMSTTVSYGGYDPISMSSIGNYTGQYIYAANSSMTLSKVEEEISPTTTINSLPRLLAIQAFQGMESQCLQDRA